MNRLNQFLQKEIIRSYKNVIKAYTSINTFEACLQELNLVDINKPLGMSFVAAQVKLEEAIETLEEYLDSAR